MKTELNDLTKGKILKKLFMFFLPIALGTLFQQLYNTADALIVGKYLGTLALAAVGGSAFTISACTINFFVALTGGASVAVAQYYGAKDDERLNRVVHCGMLFAGICGLVLGITACIYTPQILKLMDTPENTMADSIQYLRFIFLGLPFNLLYNMGASIMRATGDSRRPFIYLVVCCFTNVALDLLFVAVFQMGCAGAAIATSLSQMISMLLVVISMMRTREAHKLSLKKLRFDKLSMNKILKVGTPAALQSVLYSITNVMVQVGVNSLNSTTVAAWAVTSKFDGYYWGLVTAMVTAICSFVGQNYGAGNLPRVRKSIVTALLFYNAITAGMSTIMYLFGQKFFTFISDDAEVQTIAWEIMMYFIPFYVVWTTMDTLSGALRGMGDVVVPTIFTCLFVCVFRIVWLKVVFVKFHTVGILCLAYIVSWFIDLTAMGIYYLIRRKKLV